MVIRTRHETNEDTWFVTFTCHNWLRLFELTNSHDLVYKWLKLIDDKYCIKTTGFVVMPNHVHLLLYLTDLNVNLNTIMANAKRFMAYDLVKRLAEQQHIDLLNVLAMACTGKERAKGQVHKMFEPSFDAKPVYTLDFYIKSWITFIITQWWVNGVYAGSLQIIRTAALRFTNWALHMSLCKYMITGIIGSVIDNSGSIYATTRIAQGPL